MHSPIDLHFPRDEELLEQELSRRDAIWKQIAEESTAGTVLPETLQAARISRGQSGIYMDKEQTQQLTGSTGVTVSLTHRGTSYPDEVSPDGMLYHYPRTNRLGHDTSEINATKAAMQLRLPIFVVMPGITGETRRVRIGYVESFDDVNELFLVTFADSPSIEKQEKPFSLLSDDENFTMQKIRSRPNQQRFAFEVNKRYAGSCAVCGLQVPALLDAAHVRAKKDGGSDDARNGLLLCANHHRAYDAGLWAIHPQTLRVSTRKDGPTRQDLGITERALAVAPHADALRDAWSTWSNS